MVKQRLQRLVICGLPLLSKSISIIIIITIITIVCFFYDQL